MIIAVYESNKRLISIRYPVAVTIIKIISANLGEGIDMSA